MNIFYGLSGRTDIDRTDETKPSSERWHLFLAQPQANGENNVMNDMKCCMLIILLFLLSSCGTMEYSLNRYNKTGEHFACRDSICSRGYFLGESDFKVLFFEISIKGKKLYAKGVAKEIGPMGSIGVDYCGIFLGKVTIDNNIFLQKQISLTDENGNFRFKVKLKEGDFIIFNRVGFRPEIYHLQITP